MEIFFVVLAISGLATQLLLLLLALFDPGLEYRVSEPPRYPIDSPEFARVLGILADSKSHHDTHVEVLTNGNVFYEAELEGIRSARTYICFEAYIFQQGEIGRRFIAAFTERAQAGVKVRLVLDAIGSLRTSKTTFKDLMAAGGQVRWYMPLRWYNLPRLNNRTHRELMVVDGVTGFIGGAGVADHWFRDRDGKKRWRDTMFRVRGSAVASMQSMLSENWLEASGELLANERYYPDCKTAGGVAAMVVNSTPSHGRATRARMLFQTLIASAAHSIHITTPYFVPDRSLRRELVQAMHARGVEVKVIVPGKNSDQLMTRRSSRRLYGELLQHGAQIYEYQPAMIHVKSLVVDGIWSVVGSTNFDNRSFGINDEVNLAALDEGLAARVEQDFQHDLAQSSRVTYEEWRRRPVFERVHELLGCLLERQE
jgi:cardiolipin synthase